jgi:acid phosphatase class B
MRATLRRRRGKGFGSFIKNVFSRGKKIFSAGKKIYSRGKKFYDSNKDTIHKVAKTASDAYNTIQPHVKQAYSDSKQDVKDAIGSGLRSGGMRARGMRSRGMRARGMRGGRRHKRI